MPFSLLPAQAVANLANIGQRCLGVVPVAHSTWEFNTSSLSDGVVLPLVAEVVQWSAAGSYIYYFHCTGSPNLTLALDAFEAAKRRDRGQRAYAKVNTTSPCLYVGGSNKIASRLKQHLGYSAAKGTYSMQLLHWATSLSLDLAFTCARYDPSPTQDVLQALEDTLWDNNNPMLGRRGAR